MMGSPENEEGRELGRNGKKIFNETRHQVTLAKGFYLGKYEVDAGPVEKGNGYLPQQVLRRKSSSR